MTLCSTSAEKAWVICKFGGQSVADRTCWNTIKLITHKHLDNGYTPVIVCSALGGVSNLLENLIDQAKNDQDVSVLTEIRKRYQELSNSLDIDPLLLEDDFTKLSQIITGITLVGEVSPRVKAQVMAFGELLLTKIGTEFLNREGVNTALYDSRDLLQTSVQSHSQQNNHYLAAHCDFVLDQDLVARFKNELADVVMVQGFIASDRHGETVLLGRGGSDTSAAYFASKLGAKRCEIWTDVPGIYTANPRQIPAARLLRSLDYDEAQEIASMGAKVLHPHCLPPLKQEQIPLYVGYTKQPEREGTIISVDGRYTAAPIKSILTKYDILLLSIDTINMWQQVGFLSDVFACFKRHDLSIDLISTSQSNVTVSLDPSVNTQDSRIMNALLDDLNQFSRARIIGNCAAISLVGHNIRAVMYQLGDALEVFQEQQIHLISQAANDLNLTFVVDEDQAERLARRLHALLIEQNVSHNCFLRSWQEEFTKIEEKDEPWWHQKQDKLLNLVEEQSPIYIYEEASLKDAVNQLKTLTAVDQLFYAIKANFHENILKSFYKQGLGFECVSFGELNYIINLFPDIDRKKIIFTPNFAPRYEYKNALELGVNITLDNLHPLECWPDIFKGKDIFLRIDPGKGYGHHKYVCTGGVESKFGISETEFNKLHKLIEKHSINVIGLHVHSGSGILISDPWKQTAIFLTSLLEQFPKVRTLNLGGGLGIVEKPGQEPLDLNALNDDLIQVKQSHKSIQLWLEPGRFLVGRAAVLLAKVTQVKHKGDVTFVGIETGMNSLIRPALYGSYHEIVNLTRLHEQKTQVVNVVGPICESGDVLGFSRLLAPVKENDVILIANAGAYAHCMSSHYNLREPALELFIPDN